jgi:hypothetical protein
MPGVRPPIEGRRLAAIVCVLVLFGAEVSSLRFPELRGRWGALRAFASMSPEDARLGGSGFAFNRRLGPFLQGVARRTPSRSTIAISFANEEGGPATYAAAYCLAPRRVVGPGRVSEADFAARFDGRSAGIPGAAGAARVPFGELVRLR